MKSKVLIFLIAALLLKISESCKKDALPDGRFIGTWISEDKADTLYFINDNTFKTPRLDGVLHTYTYRYDEDSLTMQYSGPNYILLPPKTHHYTLTRSTLILDLYKLNDELEPISVVLNKQ